MQQEINKLKTIVLSSDHAGFELKEAFKNYLKQKKYQVIDLGVFEKEVSSSYARQGQMLAKEIQTHDNQLGLGFCGTGIGISIAVNRFNKIRGARITSIEDAKLAKMHNNANILLFGGREVSSEQAFKMFEEFEKNHFQGQRHIDRIKQLDQK